MPEVKVDLSATMRVDVWLWTVRQLHSRSGATAQCRAGHVKVNDKTAKSSTQIRPGDIVKLRVDGFDRILEVTKLLARRVSAPLAQECYIDHTPARLSWRDAPKPFYREPGTGRPTKKERRELDALRNLSYEELPLPL